MRELKLTDDEILMLDGKVNEEAQKVIDEVKQITMFKASDGKLFTNLQEAEEYQQFVEFSEWCRSEFTTSLCTDGYDIANEIWKKYTVQKREQ